jgi:hypothetical protein
MKPLSLSQTHRRARHDARTPQTARAFPRTDYHFQVQADDVATAPVAAPARTAPSRAQLHAFRQMTGNYLATEAKRSQLLELVAGSLIIGLAGWSLLAIYLILL